MTWWYLSFCDPVRPKGTQFLGASIVSAESAKEAVAVAHASGCNPGGEVAIMEALPELGDPPDGAAYRLLTKEEISRYGALWSGSADTGTVGLDGLGEDVQIDTVCANHNEGD